ncbi:MAG: adenosine deaminase [Bacteriovoracaceae bacterium]|nr:adenosine deaminase [Bacteriovoracaceae bacterium]
MSEIKNLSGIPLTLSDTLLQRFQKMPKAEIHVHLEGATSPETFWNIAKKNNKKLPVKTLEEWKSFFTFKDFNHFIDVYKAAVANLSTPEDYYTLLMDFIKSQAEQNIIVTEAFISLSLIPKMQHNLFLKALKNALEEGCSKYHVSVNLIGDIAREMPETQNDVLNLTLEGYKQGVFIGLGLGGIESGFPPKLFTTSYQKAFNEGLKLFSHAGETTGAQTILDSVDLLNVTRIGHGIHILQDKNILKQMKDKKIVFEVCPQSNYATGVVKKGENHPLRQMVDAGLLCTVNSDDPAMFSTTLAHEYALLMSQGFTWEELWQLNMNTLHASSLTPQEKKKYQLSFEAQIPKI